MRFETKSVLNLKEVVCPECRSALREEAEALICSGCSRAFAVRNGIPCFVELDSNALPFKEEYFEFWFKRENTHFWHVARREIIASFAAPYLAACVGAPDNSRGIEIGIGNGNVTQAFLDAGISMEGADYFYSALLFCRKRMQIPLFQADLLKLPFKERYDFIGIFDIIEHIEDDRTALRNAYEALKPGGILQVTVPACKFLWSRFDELDHKRRYSKKELIERLGEAGFKIRRVSFFMFLLFPFVYLVRKLQRYPSNTKLEHVSEVQVVPGLNPILLFIFRLERILLKFINLPIGSSLIAIAQRPA